MTLEEIHVGISVLSAIICAAWCIIGMKTSNAMKDVSLELLRNKLEILQGQNNLSSAFGAHESEDEARHDEVLRRLIRLEK